MPNFRLKIGGAMVLSLADMATATLFSFLDVVFEGIEDGLVQIVPIVIKA